MLSKSRGAGGLGKPERMLLWGAMIFGIFAAGIAFVYKIAEFIFTLNSMEVQGFADVPVTIYFVVAAGWLLLLVWCFLSGQFKNVEEPKFEMLRMEEEYERRGI
jgi:thiosulfate reductase cytochrome b subunit